MNGDLFQYALLPISCANETVEWIVNDSHKNYLSVDVLDFPDELVEQVFTLYEGSYLAYKNEVNNQLIPDSYGLLKYNRWIMFYENNDPEKKVICFCLFKTTDFGLKSSLTGSDGSKTGKRSVILFKIGSFNTHQVFGEISGKLEERILNDVPVVAFKDAKRILAHLGKADVKKKSGNHYSRKIGSLGVIVKIMVGLPEMDSTAME